jgi:hypothetical protein
MTVLGHTDIRILRDVYGSLLRPMRVPEMGAMSQPQQVVQWLKAAYEARMELAGRVGMNTAMLSYLMLVPGIPVGKGDMAHIFAEMKAECEGYLSSDEEKTHGAVVAFLDDKPLRPLEQKHWNGSWKSVEPANPVAAYAADASPASSESEVAKSAGAATPTIKDQRPLCHTWQKGKECENGPLHATTPTRMAVRGATRATRCAAHGLPPRGALARSASSNIRMGSQQRMHRQERAGTTGVILLQWGHVTHRAMKSLKWTRRQRRPMSATKIHVSGCAIHSLTEQSTGVSNMEAPSTNGSTKG